MGIPESIQRINNEVSAQDALLDQAISLINGDASNIEGSFGSLLEGTLIEIDSAVSKIRTHACYGLTTLTTVNLPNATSIETYAFHGCSILTSLYAPQVTALGTYSFYSCRKLLEVNFPRVTKIPGFCFYMCHGMERADFGAVESIDASGFGQCSGLTTLILRNANSVVTLNSSAFSGAGFAGYVYVPAVLVNSYKADSVWATYANQIRAIEDYPDICG